MSTPTRLWSIELVWQDTDRHTHAALETIEHQDGLARAHQRLAQLMRDIPDDALRVRQVIRQQDVWPNSDGKLVIQADKWQPCWDDGDWIIRELTAPPPEAESAFDV